MLSPQPSSKSSRPTHTLRAMQAFSNYASRCDFYIIHSWATESASGTHTHLCITCAYIPHKFNLALQNCFRTDISHTNLMSVWWFCKLRIFTGLCQKRCPHISLYTPLSTTFNTWWPCQLLARVLHPTVLKLFCPGNHRCHSCTVPPQVENIIIAMPLVRKHFGLHCGRLQHALFEAMTLHKTCLIVCCAM